LLGLIDLH